MSPTTMTQYVQVRFATKRRTTKVAVAGARCDTLLHRALVGIHVQHRELLDFPTHMRGGEDPRVDVRMVPLQFASRLHDFVHVRYIEGVADFNCFSFMQYVTSLSDSSWYAGERNAYQGKYAPIEQTKPFRPYVMMRGGPKGDQRHGVVGFTNTVSLCTLGVDKPLVFASNTALMDAYDCDALIEVQRSALL